MTRVIKTTYYSDFKAKNQVRINTSADANQAVARCVLHMQINRYGASIAEVWDSESGELHAQIKRSIKGDITILYQRDPREYETKLALSAFKDI